MTHWYPLAIAGIALVVNLIFIIGLRRKDTSDE
jgi:hypothetical protein